MNIHIITAAVELIDEAILMTPSPEQRKELESASNKLRKFLSKRGVFIGKNNHYENRS